MININKENKTIKQFVKLCRIALKYEKVNYYSERKRMAERESHIEMFSEKQLEMIDKVFDTYHAPIPKRRDFSGKEMLAGI